MSNAMSFVWYTNLVNFTAVTGIHSLFHHIIKHNFKMLLFKIEDYEVKVTLSETREKKESLSSS